MKILQAIALSSFLLLSMSKVCSQEDKKTKDFSILVDIYLKDMH